MTWIYTNLYKAPILVDLIEIKIKLNRFPLITIHLTQLGLFYAKLLSEPTLTYCQLDN